MSTTSCIAKKPMSSEEYHRKRNEFFDAARPITDLYVKGVFVQLPAWRILPTGEHEIIYSEEVIKIKGDTESLLKQLHTIIFKSSAEDWLGGRS